MNLVRISFLKALTLVFLVTCFAAPRAKADATLGDALLTVAVSTVAGAVLGASTLPFYEESGDHVNNIFYGAAIGAVIGVFVSAYTGVKEGPNYDDARLGPTKPSALAINESVALRLKSEGSSALQRSPGFSAGSTLAWAPVASVHF